MLFFVKGPHRLWTISIYFNRSVINLGKSLQLDIIAPNSIDSFPVNIVLEIVFSTNDKLNEEVLFTLNVVHAILSDQIIVSLVTIIDLVRYWSEEAIPITFHLFNLKTFQSEYSAELYLF